MPEDRSKEGFRAGVRCRGPEGSSSENQRPGAGRARGGSPGVCCLAPPGACWGRAAEEGVMECLAWPTPVPTVVPRGDKFPQIECHLKTKG